MQRKLRVVYLFTYTQQDILFYIGLGDICYMYSHQKETQMLLFYSVR